jgi:spore germination protein YaaH
MITFLSVSEGRAMLSSKKGRARAAEEIAAFIARGGYAGAHLDFEYLPPGDRGLLAEFLKELRPAMKGKKITMAVFPPVEFPAPWSGFHDLRTIGPFLDEVVLMCYDYHRPGTGPGPVIDLPWAERNIAEVLKHLRPEQVWLGMPAYGYSWNEAGKTAVISARAGVREARISGGSRHPSGTLYYEFGEKGARKRAFVADARTRELMAGLARRYNLRGAALWRLGLED